MQPIAALCNFEQDWQPPLDGSRRPRLETTLVRRRFRREQGVLTPWKMTN